MGSLFSHTSTPVRSLQQCNHHRRLAAAKTRCHHTLLGESASVLSHSLLPGVDRYAGRLSFWEESVHPPVHAGLASDELRLAWPDAFRSGHQAGLVLSTPFPQVWAVIVALRWVQVGEYITMSHA